jgi:hypothetical protein
MVREEAQGGHMGKTVSGRIGLFAATQIGQHRSWAAAFLLGGLLAFQATGGQAQEAIGSARL